MMSSSRINGEPVEFPPMTQQEWMQTLESRLGDIYESANKYNENPVTKLDELVGSCKLVLTQLVGGMALRIKALTPEIYEPSVNISRLDSRVIGLIMSTMDPKQHPLEPRYVVNPGIDEARLWVKTVSDFCELANIPFFTPVLVDLPKPTNR